MTIEAFLEELQDILQCEDALTTETVLEELEEWDSMAIMACMVWLEKKFAVKRSFNDVSRFKSVSDILDSTRGTVA